MNRTGVLIRGDEDTDMQRDNPVRTQGGDTHLHMKERPPEEPSL